MEGRTIFSSNPFEELSLTASLDMHPCMVEINCSDEHLEGEDYGVNRTLKKKQQLSQPPSQPAPSLEHLLLILTFSAWRNLQFRIHAPSFSGLHMVYLSQRLNETLQVCQGGGGMGRIDLLSPFLSLSLSLSPSLLFSVLLQSSKQPNQLSS